MHKRGIFIAATGQNVGKTTLCLGIFSGLRKRFKSVGFIKPVGQQHLQVDSSTIVDKDAVLFKEHFNLREEWQQISPVIFPSGFTRNFLDGNINTDQLQKKIEHAYREVSCNHSYTLVEGTGHVGVGSIVGLSNAKVASILGLDMVLIASGGLGSAYDELALNVALCEKFGVRLRGVILNRVLPEKREMVEAYFPKTLKRWNVPLIGTIPFNEFLSKPTVKDFETLFHTSLITGHAHHYRHFFDVRLIAGSLEAYEKEWSPNTLIITPATREEIIRATLAKHTEAQGREDFGCGMILTGQEPPSSHILAEIGQKDLPILYAPVCSYDAMKMITSYVAKIHLHDTAKIERAIQLVEDRLDFDIFSLDRQKNI